ncbi:hypothetical protein V7P26_09080 [Arcobacter cryaerophilus gv. pseudocryaerophilus]
MEINIIDIERERYSGNDTTGTKLNAYRVQFFDGAGRLFKIVTTNRESQVCMLSEIQGWIKLKAFKTFDYYSNDKDIFIKEACKYLANFFKEPHFHHLFIKEINRYENS